MKFFAFKSKRRRQRWLPDELYKKEEKKRESVRAIYVILYVCSCIVFFLLRSLSVVRLRIVELTYVHRCSIKKELTHEQYRKIEREKGRSTCVRGEGRTTESKYIQSKQDTHFIRIKNLRLLQSLDYPVDENDVKAYVLFPFFFLLHFLTRQKSVETSQRKRRTRITRTFLLFIPDRRRRWKRKKTRREKTIGKSTRTREIYYIAKHRKKKRENANAKKKKNITKEKRCFSVVVVAATGEWFFI